jgi:Cu(I)/Ag(I) efflux system membrane fusion protein
MSKSIIQVPIVILLAFILGIYTGSSLFSPAVTNKEKQLEAIAVNSEYFTCPMHPHIHDEHDGDCPICGMSLVPKQVNNSASNNADNPKRPEVFVQSSVLNNFSIKTTRVKRGAINRNIKIYGYVNEIKKAEAHHLKSPVAGIVRYINYPDKGNKYVKNEIILTLESDELQQLQSQYLQAVDANDVKSIRSIKQKLSSLGFTFQQMKSLVKNRILSNIYTLRSPSTGVLTESDIKLQQKIKSNEVVGLVSPLYSISAYAKVFETQWIWLEAGQQVSMSIRNIPGEIWKGEVRSVDDLAQSSTTAVKLLADFAANEKVKLRLGMQTEMNVAAESKNNVLQVPASSVIQTGSKNVVVVAKGGGYFQPVDVETGLNNGEYIEIISGLKEGMKVVVSGQFLLDSESQISAGISRISSPAQGHEN